MRKEGNLPIPPTDFLGREGEVADLLAIVDRHRLTTLTGVGGVGKTRLAIELCRRLRAGFPDGIFFFDLASIGDPAAVTDLVMSVLSISPVPSTSSAKTVLEWLAHRRAVLLFDNGEHVVDVTAGLIEQVLARTKVVVIATSREALRLNGEHIWPVRAFEQARELGEDHDDARRQSARVHQLVGPVTGREWAEQIAHQVEADVALTRDDPDARIVASVALEALLGSGNWQDCWAVLEPVAAWLHDSGERGAAATIAGFLDEHEYACRVPRRAAILASLVNDPDLGARVQQGRAIDTTDLVDQIHALLEHRSSVNRSG